MKKLIEKALHKLFTKLLHHYYPWYDYAFFYRYIAQWLDYAYASYENAMSVEAEKNRREILIAKELALRIADDAAFETARETYTDARKVHERTEYLNNYYVTYLMDILKRKSLCWWD